MSLRTFLATLRDAMSFLPAVFVPVPRSLVRLAAWLAAGLPRSLLDAETLAMLERGNAGDLGATYTLLGRAPRDITDFIPRQDARAVGICAVAGWGAPLLRLSVAIVWIVTGLLSLGLYPVAESYALLARTGITGALAPVALYGAALLDIGSGVATLALRRRRWLWIAQIAVIVAYTAIITCRLPEFWLHPYGPVLKNLPLLAAIAVLHAFYLLLASATRDSRILFAVVRHVVVADWIFTATSAVVQPVTGFYLAHLAGFPLTSRWIVWSTVLYVLGACWLPVVWIQSACASLPKPRPLKAATCPWNTGVSSASGCCLAFPHSLRWSPCST